MVKEANNVRSDKTSTSEMMRRLLKTKSIVRFLKHFDRQMMYVTFDTYITELCISKNIIPERVIIKGGIHRTYGHQLFIGKRKPSRDKVIQLAFGFMLSIDETQELLQVARKSQLYPRIKRDAAIMYALERGVSITDFQNMLAELQLPLLGKEDRYE